MSSFSSREKDVQVHISQKEKIRGAHNATIQPRGMSTGSAPSGGTPKTPASAGRGHQDVTRIVGAAERRERRDVDGEGEGEDDSALLRRCAWVKAGRGRVVEPRPVLMSNTFLCTAKRRGLVGSVHGLTWRILLGSSRSL